MTGDDAIGSSSTESGVAMVRLITIAIDSEGNLDTQIDPGVTSQDLAMAMAVLIHRMVATMDRDEPWTDEETDE